MALPTILFNSSGSDTQASGAGPSTAIFGTGAETDGTANVDLSADSPDLSGVATDGSAVLWVDTATGRQFGKITAVDNGTKIVTVANAYSASAAGLTWAIGGKRATIGNTDSRKLLSADALPGWIIRLESAETISSALTISVSGDLTTGPITLEGATGSTTVLTQSANAANLAPATASYWRFERLEFRNTNGTKTSANAVSCTGTCFGLVFKDCIFGHATNTIRCAFLRSSGDQWRVVWINCTIQYCTVTPISADNGGNNIWFFMGCTIRFNAGAFTTSMGFCEVSDCLIYENTGDGISHNRNQSALRVRNTTIHDNTGDGIDTSGNQLFTLDIFNCNITGNGGYGIRAISTQSVVGLVFCDYNNFGTGATANTSGAQTGVSAGANDLAVDPQYTDAAGGDFSVGTNVKALGFPKSTVAIGNGGSATFSFVDVGGAQREEPAGGGGGGGHPANLLGGIFQ